MEEISPDTLRGREGQRFRFSDAAGHAVVATLQEIEEHAEEHGGLMYVTFTAEEPHGLPQGTYEIAHDELATTVLFGVPQSERTMCLTFTWLTSPPDASS